MGYGGSVVDSFTALLGKDKPLVLPEDWCGTSRLGVQDTVPMLYWITVLACMVLLAVITWRAWRAYNASFEYMEREGVT